jgi:hypothetical protein
VSENSLLVLYIDDPIEIAKTECGLCSPLIEKRFLGLGTSEKIIHAHVVILGNETDLTPYLFLCSDCFDEMTISQIKRILRLKNIS